MSHNDSCSWDDAKRDSNLVKHGYDFADMAEIFDGRFVITRQDTRFGYSEERYNVLVELRGRIVNVTFTPRNGRAHLISVRAASRDERDVYNAKKQSV